MTDNQLKYALRVASAECRKHNPPNPYDRSDLFQELLLHLIELCHEKGEGMPTAYMSKRAKWAASSIIVKWRWGRRSHIAETQPPLSFDSDLDTRHHLDEYELEYQEILDALTPRQREYAEALVKLDLKQVDVARKLEVHPSAVDASMKDARKRVLALGYST